MTDKLDRQEALQTLEDLLKATRGIQEQLKKVKNWGIFDFLAGDFLVSWIKRQKIRQLNTDLEALRVDVERCQKELSDVGLSLFSGSSGTTHDRIWDIWGDNPWTDWRVIKETNHLIEEMSLLETAILSLRQSLNES